ncbi:HlyC/CorC family transporter [Psychrobium sp. 1_MG-2023]|uniref:HlyC/CorC family transporter n=1 Tax=Psychrobium sp. 1_MG-2023 TaxID=3062624 RepID=UPI000C34A143|nr:transporter associated domain-containing protein [Psychrobium sp. 1_MG-2023]MDP2560595.1 transporter associated domain-containing protein [Psychrobium sp. 1_MG-2023]PKF57581.1 magnesium/cobalt efflux protein [Alteromonadales bacterium alter-6D02]
MSEDKPPSSQSANKTWLERIGQMFQGEPQSQEELVEFIQDAEDRELIDQYTKDMIHGVLNVSRKRVRDIMIPRSQMVVIENDHSIEQAIAIIAESAHSRFPVISEDKDNVEGMLLAKDIIPLTLNGNIDTQQLNNIVRPCVIVPESKKVDVLLREFRAKRYHMAVVVDEYGGVSGLITIEDILEEIVGEIEDEFAVNEEFVEDIRKVGKQVYSIQALTTLEDFNQYFESQFDETEADTIGGLVTKAFGHLPGRGEETTVNGYQFKVMNADSRRLIQLQVKVPTTESQA